MSMLYIIPEDIAIIIWKNVFQETLNKLRWNGMEHLKKCGICKKHLLKYEDLIPITEEYGYTANSLDIRERDYHCKCMFHCACLIEIFDEQFRRTIHHRPGCNTCGKMIQDKYFYFGADSDEDSDEDSDSDEED